MKKLLLRPLVLILLTSLLACQHELSERYQNPNNVTPTPGEFLTAILNNNRVRPYYWEISTFVNWHVGVYSQSVSYLNSQSMYQQNESYIQDRWDDYYRPSANGAGVIANFRALESAYNKLTDIKKEQTNVYLQAAKVVLYDQTAQMVDLWGDIPFSEAGELTNDGKIVYAKFDSASQIYSTIIDDLKTISDYFATLTLEQSTLTEFSKQDILLSGDLGRWQRYANSLRLRLLMRLSYVDEDKSKIAVLEMLNDAAHYPLLNDAGYSPGMHDILLMPLTTYSDDLHNAFTDWTNYPAPYFALEEVLKPANDPRIPVLYDKYGATINGDFIPNAEFNAMPLTLTSVEQQENMEHYSIIDSVTFLYNTKLPGIVFTSSETSFLKAEAYERWGGGDAAQEYINGIRNSIIFYYYLNNINTNALKRLTAPSSDSIESFLSNTAFIQYEGTSEEKLAKIWTQKWIHFGFMQSIQSWAELRRTGYPQLVFNPSSRSGFELPPSRLTYPENEKTYNANYATVASRDFRDATIFWDVK
ncbi:MAG TPA: SusD/RagB family nutrient-binding outer membrane lipoprotein [Cyclobacteriaceae bacterium]